MSREETPARPANLAALEARLRGDVDLLIEMLSSSDPKARSSAAGQLRKLRDVRAVPALVRCLRSPDGAGKFAAFEKVPVLKALRDIGDLRAADAVFDVAQDASQSFEARGTAAQTLVSFGDRRGVTSLAALFGETTASHHASFRKWALPLLLDANGTEALPALRAARADVGGMERRRLDRAIRTLERLEEEHAPGSKRR